MIDDHDGSQEDRGERLGAFLRSRRNRIRPDGMATSLRRRTTGLRREEVAAAAGISTEWYIKLEQGRGSSPSLATVEGIAGALRLDDDERLHLFALAGRSMENAACVGTVPATLRAIVEGLAQPAYVTNRCWDVLAWNRAAVDLLQADFAAMAGEERNILAWMLSAPEAKALFAASWESEARRMITLFRTTCDLFGTDRTLVDRAAALRARSEHFSRWWDQHDVGVPRSGEKRLQRPLRGPITVLFSTFQSNDDPGLKLAIYSDLSEGH